MSRISVRRAQGESPSKTAVASIDDARDWTPIHMDKYNRENKNSNIIIIHKEISEAREQGRSRRRRDRRGRGSLRGRGWSSTAAPATARTPLPPLLPFIIYRIQLYMFICFCDDGGTIKGREAECQAKRENERLLEFRKTRHTREGIRSSTILNIIFIVKKGRGDLIRCH